MIFNSSRKTRSPKNRAPRLQLERLEDRDCPSGGHLLVTDWDIGAVLRYNGTTGAFVDAIVPKHSGGLNHAHAVLFGPHDHDLYVSSGQFGGPGQLKAVLRYDGTTGAFREEFTKGGNLDSPRGFIFGPDGNLYVCEGRDPGLGRVARFDGRTGAYLGDFVPTGSGGLTFPQGLVFGPSGRGAAQFDLYVASAGTNRILRYDGGTGAFLGVFAGDDPGTPADEGGGLERPIGLTFGPDGNLYVGNASYLTNRNPAVLRFQGPAGPTPGAFLGNFVPPGRGGLRNPTGVLFGPDGNGDGRQDLYVTNEEFTGLKGKLGTVKRYDGVTGAFIDTFVEEGSGGLNDPVLLTFTETDPTTLAYTGDHLVAASVPPLSITESLDVGRVQPLFTEALARWHAAGADTSRLGNIQIQIGNLGGNTLGMASGHTIWLDDNAAGWGWFVDATPWDDSEFNTAGNQGEQRRMDLLTVLEHEIGHLLGHDHDEGGVMQETLDVGTRRTVDPVNLAAVDRVDAVFALFALDTDAPWIGAGPLVFGRMKR
jgi:hypothetical protein